MKVCYKCKRTRPLSEFYKNHHKSKDGYQSECKICGYERHKEYRQTKRGKITKKHYDQSEKGKAALIRYRQSEKGKISRKASQNRFRINHPERCRAGDAVKIAMRSGKLPRSSVLKCHYCPNQAEEYHHWRGYAPKYWLDVIPVCIKCHHEYGKKVA